MVYAKTQTHAAILPNVRWFRRVWWSLLHVHRRPRRLRACPQPDEVMVDADPNVHQALEVLKDLQREGGLARRLDRPRTRRLGEHLLKSID